MNRNEAPSSSDHGECETTADPTMSMRAVRVYVDELQTFAGRVLAGQLGPGDVATVVAELNGRFGRYLDRRVPRRERRLAGAFFTGSSLADTMVAPLASVLSGGPTLFDPACGSGDLLIAAARHLPIRRTFASTLRLWSVVIGGRDLYPELVWVTKARLILLAWQRCGSIGTATNGVASWFPNLVSGNGLHAHSEFAQADVVLMNPPFRLTRLSADAEWGSGRASEASEFLGRFLAQARKGARIAAVLPDSMRSGPRYRHLRDSVEQLTQVDQVALQGRVRGADIDVFTLHATRVVDGTFSKADWKLAASSDLTVASRFTVSVGPVVPHRDPQAGPELPYIHARILPLTGDWRGSTEKRRYGGRAIKPPFVVVRRTSEPRQRRRLTATLILGPLAVAVENHLLVLRPHDGRIGTCRQLLRRLRQKSAAEWINQRIRCRHLTVEALAELPLSDTQ
jgi:N-6 DNA Methylase